MGRGRVRVKSDRTSWKIPTKTQINLGSSTKSNINFVFDNWDKEQQDKIIID